MPSEQVVASVQHPDNLLDSDSLSANLAGKLLADGIRFAIQLQTSTGHSFLLCGRRCPSEAGADMLRDALRVRQSA